MASSLPSGSSSVSCLEARLCVEKDGERKEASRNLGRSTLAQRKWENLCLPRKREKFKLDVESRFPVPTLHRPPSSHDPTSSPHRTHPSTLQSRPGCQDVHFCPSLNGNESSTQQALSLVRRSLPLPVVGFLFSSALSSLPSAHAELSSGRSLLHQDGGQWARGQRLSTPAPSCARSQEQRANREQQSHQQSHQRGDTSEQRVLPFKMASSQYLVG